MLNPEIRELKENIAKAVNQFVEDAGLTLETEQQEKSRQISRKIAALKEPYLREILTAAQTNSSLDKNYTASDILTVLEDLDDFVNGLDE
jgi:Zn-dependent oligopeptidase